MTECIFQYGWAIGIYAAIWAVIGMIIGRITAR